MTHGLYIYGIIAADGRLEFGKIGIEGEDVYTIGSKGIACVVSDSPAKEYTADKDHVEAHAKVLEEVGKRHSMLPIRFGTVAPSEKEILSFLKGQRKQIKKLIKVLRGKVEIELEVLWKDMKHIFSEIAASHPTLKRLKELSREKTRDELIMAGELVSRLLHKRKEQESNKFIKALKRLCEEYQVMPSNMDEMILNASFLVDSNKLDEFNKAADALADKYSGEVKIRYIGPIAPCSFVTLRM